jgi:hypothetical protein
MMILSTKCIAGIVVLFAAPALALAQQTGTSQGPPASFASSTIEGSYAPGNGVPSRRVQTRTESNGREVITETMETPDVDGRFRMSVETRSETVRTGADSTRTKLDVFVPDAQGRPRLLETTQTDVQTSRDGSSRSVANTMTSDVNGRLAIASREIQETKSVSPTVKQTDTSIYLPGVNQALLESERLQQTERKISPAVTQSESTRFLRDGSGRWQATEARNQEVRTSGASRVTEETVQRIGDNGRLALSEKKVTTQSKSGGQDNTVIETYSGTGLQLNERVRTTTSTTSDRGQQTVREVEARHLGEANAPLRVIQRTIETVRQIGPDRWEMQRQVFALDGNGRLVPVLTEKGQASGK